MIDRGGLVSLLAALALAGAGTAHGRTSSTGAADSGAPATSSTQSTPAPQSSPSPQPTPPATSASTSSPGVVLTEPPSKPDVAARYLFYLHGRIVEEKGLRPTDEVFGVYEYPAILDAFASRGFTVVSEARPLNTNVAQYAHRVRDQVQALLTAGVPPEHVTVVGFSKGGAIAILSSALIHNDHVGFVFLAACGDWASTRPGIDPHGRILSIFEASDGFGRSCGRLFKRAAGPIVTREIELHTGEKHGTFYRVSPLWLDPAVSWARGETGG